MRRHLWLFAACAPLLTWSGLGNTQDQSLGGYDRVYNCAGRETYLWASGSLAEECLSDAEDWDQGVDEDEDPIEDPTADWA